MKIRDYLRRCMQSYPDKVAYIDGERKTTWRRMFERSQRLGAALQQLGVRRGDVVAMQSADSIEAVELVFACAAIGAVRVGVNRGYSQSEMAHVVRDSDARVLILQPDCCKLLLAHAGEFRREGRLLVGLGADHGLERDYETLIAGADAEPERVDLRGDDPIAISYTSGTTGYPKGVVLGQHGVRDMFVHFVLSTGLRHEEVWINPTSMAWATFMLSTMSVVNGMTTVMPGREFTAAGFLSLCSRNRVTAMVVVPTMLQRLLAEYQQNSAAYDLSSLRMVSYGSAPATPALIQEAIRVFGVELLQLYGLTECGAWATYLQHGDHLRALAGCHALLGSCGKPGVYCDVAIRDENGAPVPRGSKGELWIRTDTVMLRYNNLPELTAEVLRDGWLRTHDIGWQDEQGYIYLTDRRNFLIITGAANVYPSIVESTIASHPAVREVAVVGAPHPEWGEAVVAMVALRSGHDVAPEDVVRHCQGRVAKWEVPKFVEIVPELPKGPTLKILKKQIKDRYANERRLLPWFAGAQVQSTA